jgi:His-Xaa-Ser system radical SAM maturase HxsC
MVEEIKQIFKGDLKGELLSFFVGKVTLIDKDVVILKGNYPNAIQNQDVSIYLSEAEIPENQLGYSNVKGLDNIKVGDILSASTKQLRSLFRPYTNHNSVFATVRCNSNCLMCSQPPLDYDDTEEYYLTWKYAITLMPADVEVIGFTGGEPMLMGDYLVDLINDLTDKFPNIQIDILSNGRLQALPSYKELLSNVKSPSNVIFAVPMYSDYYQDHDHIVQAKDAFYQTILGVHNLSSLGFKIEIRIVLHKLSLNRLGQLAKFIHSNFPFVYHITFMGLEIIGYTNANKEQLLIEDNGVLNEKLNEAIDILNIWDYNLSIYNLPYCFLDEKLWSFARQSISDWKNSFHEDCSSCRLKENCAGFFSWNLKYASVNPIK